MPSQRAATPFTPILFGLILGCLPAAQCLAQANGAADSTAVTSPAPPDSNLLRLRDLQQESNEARLAGEMTRARELLDRGVALALQIAKGDSLNVAAISISKADFCIEVNDAPCAERSHSVAIRIAERAGSKGEGKLLLALGGRGYARIQLGNLAGARADFDRALALLDANPEPDQEILSSILNSYGVLLRDIGEFDAAGEMLERSLSLSRQVPGPLNSNTAGTLSNLGAMAQMLGDYERSLEYLEEALRIDLATQGDAHPYVASSQSNVGGVLHFLGRDREALPYFESAVQIARTTLSPEDPTVGRYLVGVAAVQHSLGDIDAARENFANGLRLLEAGRREGTVSPAELAVALGDQARLFVELGEYDSARTALDRSLGMRQELYGAEHAEVAAALHDLGNLRAVQGELPAARELHERSLALRIAALGDEHPDVGATLQDLAAVCLRQRDWTAASLAALRAEGVGREHLRRLARGQSEREALAYAAVRATGCDIALAAGVGSEDPALVRSAWDALLRSRGLVLDEIAFRRQAIASASDPELVARVDSLRTERSRLASLVARPAGARAAGHLAEIESCARRKERLERRVARLVGGIRRQVIADSLGIADVARALPDDAALIAYTTVRRQNGHDLCALVLAAGVPEISAVMLGDAAAIDALVMSWRNAVMAGAVPAGPLRNNAEQSCTAAGNRLRAAIWDPLVPKLHGVTRVFVVPDGTMQWVSLPALPDGQGGYCIESGPLIHVLTDERDLLLEPNSPSLQATGLLALGGPDFDADPKRIASANDMQRTQLSLYRGARASCQSLAKLRFERLPLAGREVRDISAIYDGADRGPVSVFAEHNASETRLKLECHGRNVIHLATHGFYLDRACSGIELGRKEWALSNSGSAPNVAAASVWSFTNPLLLSGLAFAGANRREQTGAAEDDGILTAEEVASLDLTGTQWVVLSACDSGLGLLAAGEGVLGLRRAFRAAGARALVLSLWPVQDAATQDWMVDLYRSRFADGADTAQAVHAASLAALKRERANAGSGHPFHWAGLIAVGDWH